MLDLLQLPKHTGVILSGSTYSSLIRSLLSTVRISLFQQVPSVNEQGLVDP